MEILNGGDGADEFIIRTTGFRRVEIEDFDIGDDTLEIVSLQKKKDVSFEDDGEGNLLITFKGNEILLTGVAVGDFGFGDLG